MRRLARGRPRPPRRRRSWLREECRGRYPSSDCRLCTGWWTLASSASRLLASLEGTPSETSLKAACCGLRTKCSASAALWSSTLDAGQKQSGGPCVPSRSTRVDVSACTSSTCRRPNDVRVQRLAGRGPGLHLRDEPGRPRSFHGPLPGPHGSRDRCQTPACAAHGSQVMARMGCQPLAEPSRLL